MWLSVESKDEFKDTSIDVVWINKCACDEKSSLISFSKLFRKNEHTQIWLLVCGYILEVRHAQV